jgi:hypothetical protein
MFKVPAYKKILWLERKYTVTIGGIVKLLEPIRRRRKKQRVRKVSKITQSSRKQE